MPFTHCAMKLRKLKKQKEPVHDVIKLFCGWDETRVEQFEIELLVIRTNPSTWKNTFGVLEACQNQNLLLHMRGFAVEDENVPENWI